MSNHRKSDKTTTKRGMTVEVRPGTDERSQKANLEHAIKTLKRRIQQEGLVKDVRKNEYFETAGQKKRRRMKDAVRRQAKSLRLAKARDM